MFPFPRQQIAIRRSKHRKTGAGFTGTGLADALWLAWIYGQRCPGIKQGRSRAVQETYTLWATLIVTGLSLSLEVVVEHARMTDQTHLLGSFTVAGSDQGAAPRTDNVVSGLGIFHLVVGLANVSAHAFRLKQISFQLRTRPGIND